MHSPTLSHRLSLKYLLIKRRHQLKIILQCSRNNLYWLYKRVKLRLRQRKIHYRLEAAANDRSRRHLSGDEVKPHKLHLRAGDLNLWQSLQLTIKRSHAPPRWIHWFTLLGGVMMLQILKKQYKERINRTLILQDQRILNSIKIWDLKRTLIVSREDFMKPNMHQYSKSNTTAIECMNLEDQVSVLHMHTQVIRMHQSTVQWGQLGQVLTTCPCHIQDHQLKLKSTEI